MQPATPLIIRVIPPVGTPRENIIALLLLSNTLERKERRRGPGLSRRSTYAPRLCLCDRRRSPANYSRNIAITVRVIGNATNFHGAHIPCASSSPLITRSADNNARARVVRRDNKRADAIIFPACSSSAEDSNGEFPTGKRKREETRERTGTRSQGIQRG